MASALLGLGEGTSPTHAGGGKQSWNLNPGLLDSGGLHRMSFEQSPLPFPATASLLVPLLPASPSPWLYRWRLAEQAGALGTTQV